MVKINDCIVALSSSPDLQVGDIGIIIKAKIEIREAYTVVDSQEKPRKRGEGIIMQMILVLRKAKSCLCTTMCKKYVTLLWIVQSILLNLPPRLWLIKL